MRVPAQTLARCLLGCALPTLACSAALGQDQEIQRALIQRDQQSAGFALQLQQSQQKDTSNHLAERQRLDNLSARQLQSVTKDTPQELRPYERQKAADERVLLFAPPAVRTRLPETAGPLPAQMPQAVTPIAPAY